MELTVTQRQDVLKTGPVIVLVHGHRGDDVLELWTEVKGVVVSDGVVAGRIQHRHSQRENVAL